MGLKFTMSALILEARKGACETFNTAFQVFAQGMSKHCAHLTFLSAISILTVGQDSTPPEAQQQRT